jgi:signal transduction histidine kinase
VRDFLRTRWTIRVRLTVLYGGLFFLAGALLLGVTYLLMEQSLDRRIGAEREIGAFRMQARDLPAPPGATIRVDGRDVPVNEALALFRADQQQFRRDTLDSLLTQGGIALVGVGAVAGAFGWLLAGRALRPVNAITETAQRIAAADSAGHGLHERIALRGPRDEIKELADTFDAMLERLDRSFDGQRRFVANASHELRTPLALNRALVELAVSRPEACDETKRLGEALLAVNERHERLIDGLLTLADSENAITERAPVDLAEVAAHVIDQAGPVAREYHIEIIFDALPSRTTGDPVLLERLVQNLIDNAIRHNRAGGSVEVRTVPRDRGPTIVVENTGPQVPSYDIETLFQPFRRLTGERLGGGRGLGLGLSIVRAVARAHGGSVHAEPRAGGGLTVTVTLPTALEPAAVHPTGTVPVGTPV